MPTILLTTKFHTPSRRVNLVQRSDLLERLNTGLSGKLALVAAPAEFGKITLVADWIANGLPKANKGRVTWLSLDNNDNPSTHFLAYVIAASQTVGSSLGKVSETALQTSPLPPIERVLTKKSVIGEQFLPPYTTKTLYFQG